MRKIDNSFDLNGNRTNAGFVIGADNRLLSDGTFTYTYDAEGNRLTKTRISNGEIDEYTWDYRNRLEGVIRKDSGAVVILEVSFTYDCFDRRIAKTVDADGAGAGVAVSERFVYDGEHIALVFDDSGSLTHRYLHGPQRRT